MSQNKQDTENAAEQQQFIRGMLHVAVLAELEHSKRYGAELLIALDKTPFSSKVGTLYPLLGRMERSGLLSADWQIEPGQTPRKYYRITSLGREKLTQYRAFLSQIQTYLGGKKK
jgi:PadR family transcriptional regulator PadR